MKQFLSEESRSTGGIDAIPTLRFSVPSAGSWQALPPKYSEREGFVGMAAIIAHVFIEAVKSLLSFLVRYFYDSDKHFTYLTDWPRKGICHAML
jgi:hypothetical protein